MARNQTQKSVGFLLPKKPPRASYEQLLYDANAFSQRFQANRLALNHFGLISFALIFVLPTIAAIIYFSFLASDQYFAESRFAVRSMRDKSVAPDMGTPKVTRQPASSTLDTQTPGGSNRDAAAGTTNASGGVAGALSSLTGELEDRQIAIDAYVLTNFIQSRNIVLELDKDAALRTIYSRSEADWLTRFDRTASTEALWQYWLGKVTPTVDTISGIVTLRVLAFRPDDALKISEDVLRISSRMVSDYSQKIRTDTLKNARSTLDDAAKRYEETLVALQDFRNVDLAINPVEAATEKLKTLILLETDRARAEREQWISARVTSPESMTTRSYSERIVSLTQQIDKLQAELTEQNEKIRTASVAIGQYQNLALTRTFAERSYTMAQAAYERARFEAEYKGIVLAVFLPPRKPEMALFPRRLVNILLVMGGGIILWALVRLISASVIEFVLLRH